MLNISGPATTLDLKTMNGRMKRESTIIDGVEVQSVVGGSKISLSKCFTRDCIPCNRDSIPTGDTLADWPHLSGIELPPYYEQAPIGFVDWLPLLCCYEALRGSHWWRWGTIWLEDEFGLVCPRSCWCWCKCNGWVWVFHIQYMGALLWERSVGRQCWMRMRMTTSIVTCQGWVVNIVLKMFVLWMWCQLECFKEQTNIMRPLFHWKVTAPFPWIAILPRNVCKA